MNLQIESAQKHCIVNINMYKTVDKLTNKKDAKKHEESLNAQ